MGNTWLLYISTTTGKFLGTRKTESNLLFLQKFLEKKNSEVIWRYRIRHLLYHIHHLHLSHSRTHSISPAHAIPDGQEMPLKIKSRQVRYIPASIGAVLSRQGPKIQFFKGEAAAWVATINTNVFSTLRHKL